MFELPKTAEEILRRYYKVATGRDEVWHEYIFLRRFLIAALNELTTKQYDRCVKIARGEKVSSG